MRTRHVTFNIDDGQHGVWFTACGLHTALDFIPRFDINCYPPQEVTCDECREIDWAFLVRSRGKEWWIAVLTPDGWSLRNKRGHTPLEKYEGDFWDTHSKAASRYDRHGADFGKGRTGTVRFVTQSNSWSTATAPDSVLKWFATEGEVDWVGGEKHYCTDKECPSCGKAAA